MLAKTNYGFEFVDDSGSTPSITGVELAGTDTVLITLSAIPSGGNQKLRYAFTGTAGSKPGAQVAGSARGNLRDSDAAVGLSGNTLYNWAVHFEKPITVDTAPPVITNIDISVTNTSLIFEWTTDEPANTQVEYGLLAGLGESTVVTNSNTKTTTHSVSLSNLLPCTMYYLKAVSTDRLSQQSKSQLQTVSTSGCTGSASITTHPSETADVSTSSQIDMISNSTGVTLAIPQAYSAQ